MSNPIINPWELADERGMEVHIPDIVVGKFMTVRIAPPKGKSVRDGKVATLALISYIDQDGKEITMTEVAQSTSGYAVSFPNGKRGVMVTKYRGPYGWYNFRRCDNNAAYSIGKVDPKTKINDRLTKEFAAEYLSKTNIDWANIPQIEKDEMIDEYFHDFYMFALAKDYNLPVEVEPVNVPTVGLVTDFYRLYTPAKESERFGRIIASKYAVKEGKPNLPGDYTTVDEDIAVAVYAALTEVKEANTGFNPAEFAESTDEEPII